MTRVHCIRGSRPNLGSRWDDLHLDLASKVDLVGIGDALRTLSEFAGPWAIAQVC